MVTSFLMRTAPGLVVAGKYKLEDLVGKGGMGEVWRAFDQSLERAVALKFISDDVLERASVRSRFIAEAKAAARLRTPHVVSIYEQGLIEDTPYIAMELLEGEDLRARLKRRRRLSPAEVCAIVDQIALGLRVAHAEGIVHRDLKPGNVFLAREGDRETVKLLDFGVAKRDTGRPNNLTATGEMVGSVYYMSPEQVRGSRDLDARADIWSLGVLCYRALTGRLPFKGESVGDVAVNICTTDPKPPTAVRPDLPGELDDFFRQALAREPDQRFRTATALADALIASCGQDLAPPSSSALSFVDNPLDDPSFRPGTPAADASGIKARSTLGYSPEPTPGRLEGARSTMAYGPDHPAVQALAGGRSTAGFGKEAPGARSTAGYGAEPAGARATMAYSPEPAPQPAKAKPARARRPSAGNLERARSTVLAYRTNPEEETDDQLATHVAPKRAPFPTADEAFAKNASEPPRPFADTVASSPGDDEELDTSLDLDDSVVAAPQARPPLASKPAVVPDLELPTRPSRTPQRPRRATEPALGTPRTASAPADAPRPRPAPPAPEVRPIAPAVAAMRAGVSSKPAPHPGDAGPSVEPAMVRRLVGAAIAVALGAGASSVVGAGLGPAVPGVLALLACVGAAVLWRRADAPAVRVAAAALAVVAIAVAATIAPSMAGSVGTLAAVASGAAAVVALGLSAAGAGIVRGELERHMPQGILVVVMILLGVAATAQLGRRAVTAMEAPSASSM